MFSFSNQLILFLSNLFYFNYNNKDINDRDTKKILLNTLNNTEANT